ncbi:MAG: T9SS type A sorting domain-containing protein, partial [Flavobacteriales bacterium]|nr:T9SS type A sorting domain-containing protein [Flavobacteriales bacterium]
MKFFISFTFLLATFFSFGQQTINGTLMHGGIQRTYILYVPTSYSAVDPAPLVFNFHGYTSSANAQIFYGEFRPIADTAGFLLVVPQGTTDGQGNTYWNANWGGTVNDVSFTEALLDDISANYNINQDRVYSTGMSNGGFMSYYLACNLSNRIAAIASVTGAMTKGTPTTCNPQHPTPILEIHGDADGTVPYLGSNFSESTQVGLNYWINFNNTNTSPSFTAISNINTTDNSTVEHYVYTAGDNCVEVEHYKILNGGHTWPGAAFNTGNGATNHDIEASLLIWEFFLRYDINGKIGCTVTGVDDSGNDNFDVNVYPNPANDFLTVSWNNTKEVTSVRIKNILGVEVLNVSIEGLHKTKISTQKISKGIYFLEMRGNTGVLYSE